MLLINSYVVDVLLNSMIHSFTHCHSDRGAKSHLGAQGRYILGPMAAVNFSCIPAVTSQMTGGGRSVTITKVILIHMYMAYLATYLHYFIILFIIQKKVYRILIMIFMHSQAASDLPNKVYSSS